MKIRLEDYEVNEFGLGALFADMYGDTVKYLTKKNVYRIWNNESGLWICDESEQIHEIVKHFITTKVPLMVEKIEDESVKKRYESLIKRRNNMASVSSILKCARSRPNMTATADDFDLQSHLVNLKNGVLDLDACELLEYDKKYMITKTMNVSYNPDETMIRGANSFGSYHVKTKIGVTI